ncbi:MAG TPA: hypothetical protein VFD26_11260 [Methyloceanibacter sp.]|nr:hypothetical protein [Methyloceanibacter sp.]
MLEDLDRIDAAREELDDARTLLITTLHRERHERVRVAFQRFLDAGGVTARDFEAFLDGSKLRGCAKRRGHLRLVADNRRRKTRGSRAGTGPSAA